MSEVRTRKPLLKKKPTGKFKMHDFQIEDLAFMSDLDASANWSEMGAMKTSTAEWLWERKLSHIPNPRVLVITTKSGKGTYYESLWETLPEWDVYTVDTKKARMVLSGRTTPFNVDLPDPLHFRPVVVVAHYHCFTNRACIPKPVEIIDPDSGMKKNKLTENGTFEMEFPFCYSLLNREWDLVVVDEAHRMKNMDAQWTRNIKKLTAQYKHIMTGTGFINNPAEIWSLLNFLYPKTYSSYHKFKDHYCEIENYSGWEKIIGIKKDKELEFKDLVRRVGVRRSMLECFPNIPEPFETVVPVELNATQAKMYDDIKEELSTLDQKGVPLHSANVLSALNRLRQICVATPEVIEDYYDALEERRIIKVKLVEPSSKLDATMDIIEGLEWDSERRDQVVVFSSFRDPLELLKARLEPQYNKNGALIRKGIPYLHLHAQMGDKDRYNMWKFEWPKQEHQVFMCTLAVGSESINLSSAHRAIFLDQSWSPKDNQQAIGRVYRPGQTTACQLIYIRAEGTVDYRVLDTNNTKVGWFNQIFGEPGTDDEEEDEGIA